MGSALHIPLPARLGVGTTVKVKVSYATTEACTALQWLDKEYVQPDQADDGWQIYNNSTQANTREDIPVSV